MGALWIASLLVVLHVVAGLRVLMVQAHADDETAFAGALFAMSHNVNGTVDILVVTDGQGGFAHSMAAAYLYHSNIGDNETVARERLPKIRKEELLCSARMLLVDNVYFLDQPDVAFTTDPIIVLKKWWNATVVADAMAYFMQSKGYDVIMTMLPTAGEHGEHKAATILALETVDRLPASSFPSGKKPIVLGGTNPGNSYVALPGFPIIAAPRGPAFAFNRSTTFGINNDTLNYNLIVAWSYACHKSQGGLGMELVTGLQQAVEYYWVYDLNAQPSSMQVLKTLFDALAAVPWINKFD